MRVTRRSTAEWDKLAKWVIENELFSDNVRWLIQIPRLYDVFKKSGSVSDFQEVVRSACAPPCLGAVVADDRLAAQTSLSPCTKSPPTRRPIPSSTSSSNASSASTRSTTSPRPSAGFTASSPSRRTGTRRRIVRNRSPREMRVELTELTSSAIRVLAVLLVRQHHVAEQLAA